jgi:hypothetical protein
MELMKVCLSSPGYVDVEAVVEAGAVALALDLGLEELREVEDDGERHDGHDVLGQAELAGAGVVQRLRISNNWSVSELAKVSNLVKVYELKKLPKIFRI